MERDSQNEKLNNIFEACLERLFRGESMERCLGDYPDFASELEPLLETAIALRRAADIKPREEFRARARYEFQRAIAPAERPKPRPFSFLSRWATAPLVVLIILLISSTTVAASAVSMPDSPLYPVKLAAEQARLMLPASSESKAATYADFMDRRVTEIIYMAEKGDRQEVEVLVKRLDSRLIKLAAMTQAVSAPVSSEMTEPLPALREAGPQAAAVPTPEPAPEAEITGRAPETDTFKGNGRLKSSGAPASKLREKLARYAANHPAKLKAALDKAPESVRQEIMRAISTTVSGYERVLKTLD